MGSLLVWGSRLCGPSADTPGTLFFLFASLPALHTPAHELAHLIMPLSRKPSLMLSFRYISPARLSTAPIVSVAPSSLPRASPPRPCAASSFPLSPSLGPAQGLRVKLASVLTHLLEPHKSSERKAKQILSPREWNCYREVGLLSITRLLGGWAGIRTQDSKPLASVPPLALGSSHSAGEDRKRNHSEDRGR